MKLAHKHMADLAHIVETRTLHIELAEEKRELLKESFLYKLLFSSQRNHVDQAGSTLVKRHVKWQQTNPNQSLSPQKGRSKFKISLGP